MVTRATNSPLSRTILVASLLLFTAASVAQDGRSLHKTVNGIDVYLGVVPAELVGAHPRAHPERDMHGGVAAGGYHVMVALFERTTGKRITDAKASARLVSPSRQGPETPLEPMTIAGALTYGNYFSMVRGGSYRIDVQIRRPGSPDAIVAIFNWTAD